MGKAQKKGRTGSRKLGGHGSVDWTTRVAIPTGVCASNSKTEASIHLLMHRACKEGENVSRAKSGLLD